MLDNPARLHDRAYQAYAVLTMCRTLYTIRHGGIVSMPTAARWASATLPAPWPALIDQARAWPHTPQPSDLDATLALIRHTLARAQKIEPPPDNK